MATLREQANNLVTGVGAYLLPVLKESQFDQKGMLTPAEFVRAGDNLVQSCKTWEWASGPAEHRKDYLPAEKQFLITRNVPCRRRLAESRLQETLVDQDDDVLGGGGWLSAESGGDGETKDADGQQQQQKSGAASGLNLMMGALVIQEDYYQPHGIVDELPEQQVGSGAAAAAELELEEEELEPQHQDPAVFRSGASSSAAAAASESSSSSPPLAEAAVSQKDPQEAVNGDSNSSAGEDDHEDPAAGDEILRTRTYDITLCYDNYYRTPRLTLMGYDERGQPLTLNQVMEDISSTHAHQTVTADRHPHLQLSHVHIHPCEHANVMKRLVDRLAEGSPDRKRISVDRYLFLFLKFMTTVMPNIEYDLTVDV